MVLREGRGPLHVGKVEFFLGGPKLERDIDMFFFLWFCVCQECLWRNDFWKLNLQGRNYSCWMWEKFKGQQLWRNQQNLLQQVSASCSLNPFDEDMPQKRGALDVRRSYRRFASKHGTVERVFWSSRVHQCVHYSNSCLKKAWRGGPECRLQVAAGQHQWWSQNHRIKHWYLWSTHPRHLSDLSVSFCVE